MQTATVDVKYVNPPKEGKQYGSIKGVNNDSWPVKKERIHEFEPGKQYEIAFTQAASGFRNIIGVKAVVPAAEPEIIRGNFTHVDMQAPQRNGATLMARPAPQIAQPRQAAPQPNGYYRPTHPRDARRMFITATLGHFIETGRVDCNAQAIANAVMEIAAAYDHVLAKDDE